MTLYYNLHLEICHRPLILYQLHGGQHADAIISFCPHCHLLLNKLSNLHCPILRLSQPKLDYQPHYGKESAQNPVQPQPVYGVLPSVEVSCLHNYKDCRCTGFVSHKNITLHEFKPANRRETPCRRQAVVLLAGDREDDVTTGRQRQYQRSADCGSNHPASFTSCNTTSIMYTQRVNSQCPGRPKLASWTLPFFQCLQQCVQHSERNINSYVFLDSDKMF